MSFDFVTAGKIRFGSGAATEVAALASNHATRLLVVCGAHPDRLSWLTSQLDDLSTIYTVFQVSHEPDIATIRAGLEQARGLDCDSVLSCGGGSVIDTGKALAALMTNEGDPLDYLEVVGRGKPLVQPSLPHIAVPTTAGTGAEVTKNAVLAVPDQQVKVSLRSETMLPTLAVVDPLLTHSLPPEVTASTGLDAFTQCVEPYVSHQANQLTDILALEGIRLAGSALPIVYAQGNAASEREAMAFASLLGGLALANAKLGAVHGFAGVIGGMFTAPHGAVCARLLPYVCAQNVRALATREPKHPVLERYQTVSQVLTGRKDVQAGDGIAWIQNLCTQLDVPRLQEYGVSQADAANIVAKSSVSSSMQGNPIALTTAEMTEILEQAIG